MVMSKAQAERGTRIQDGISYQHTLKTERRKLNGEGGHADLARRRVRGMEQLETANHKHAVY